MQRPLELNHLQLTRGPTYETEKYRRSFDLSIVWRKSILALWQSKSLRIFRNFPTAIQIAILAYMNFKKAFKRIRSCQTLKNAKHRPSSPYAFLQFCQTMKFFMFEEKGHMMI